MATAGPFLKWVGGKGKLLEELHTRMPSRWGNYFEPFAGGGALFFSLSHGLNATLSDTNVALMETYEAIAKDVDAVIEHLTKHKAAHAAEKYYYEVRAVWNQGMVENTRAERAAAFIYLNKTGYNGLYRVNKKGGYNVPKGRYDNPSIFDEAQLRDASSHLGGTRLFVCQYHVATQHAVAGDFVYFDPPYDPHSKTSNFTSYTKDAFGKDQQRELAEHARSLRERGVQVMLSNNDTPFIRELYAGFNIASVQVGRAINSKAEKRGKVGEVIITSYKDIE